MNAAKTFLVVCFFLHVWASQAQQRMAAFDMNDRLGRGINMGNTFEAPTETAWGNPWNPAYFRMISELGFDHVRLPVRWEPSERSMETSPFTITPDFLDRIQAVVDTALKYQLHIIVNMHHHDLLYEEPSAQKERFLSQWSQIAGRFKDYPDSVLFEVLNEPHGDITPSVWNEYFADALSVIRQTNPTRIVLMGIAEYGGLGAVPQLVLPNDEYIIVSPHYYNPFTFTHQGAEWVSGADPWLGTTWSDTEAERQTIESEFNYILHFSEVNHVPVHVGEFGAYSKADPASRQRWTRFLARWFEEKNISWAYWEFSAGFGIYNPATKQYDQMLVDALLHDEMPEALAMVAVPVYTSNFSNGLDGWSLVQQGGAAGSLSFANGKLNVNIESGGTETWHLQLIKNNILLEKDKLYKISFTARAEVDRSITAYAGKASTPWNAYSSANATPISSTEAVYVSTFMMASPTDPSARLVFDIGKNVNDIVISDIKVESLVQNVTSLEHVSNGSTIHLFPNPTSGQLIVKGLREYTEAVLSDMDGRTKAVYTLAADHYQFDISQLPQGVYVLSFSGALKKKSIRIVKN